jgi:hypothetical protein
LLTHLTLEAFVGVHYGTRGGEFRAGFDFPAQLVATPVMMGNTTVNVCDPLPARSFSPILLDLGVALRMKI